MKLMKMKYKVLAICLKTYLNEDDVDEFCNDELLDISQIRYYRKGKTYFVVREFYDEKYFKIIE